MVAKLLTIAIRNMRRHLRRTIFTALTFAVAVFIYTVLVAVPLTMDRITDHASKGLRLIVTERNGTRAASTDWSTTLPFKDCDQVMKMPHVLGCAPEISWGGYYRDPRDLIMTSAITADLGTVDTIADYRVPRDLVKEFMSDRRYALVGAGLMHEHHWKLREPFTLRDAEAPSRAITFIPIVELPTEYLSRAFWFNSKLLDVEHFYGSYYADRAAFIVVRVDRPENMGPVAVEIDENFHNSEAETQTNTESDSVANVITGIGDVRTIIYSLCLVVLATVLLIAANSMAMMVRDRTGEVAVMRAMGFRRTHIAMLLLSEAAFIGLIGAWIGAAVTLWVFGGGMSLGKITGGLGYIEVRPSIATAAVAVALVVSLLSAIVPVLGAIRSAPAAAFRKVT